MGATYRSRWGGRWTAVNSLWTYAHRVLHLLNIASTDNEELALLSGPLIRLRHSHHVLAHHVTPLHPDEPLGFVKPSETALENTLFFLHFDIADPTRPDRIRLATAASSQTTPRAWICVDHKTGLLSLTSSERHAAVFDLRLSSRGNGQVCLHCPCAAGRYLSMHDKTCRARVAAQQPTHAETFLLDAIALPPTLTLDREPPLDCTMSRAYFATREMPVRIQSRALGFFLTSKPGMSVGGGGGKDVGWDGFTLEYDSPTRSVCIRDSRGLYLRFGQGFLDLVGGEGRGERFWIDRVGDDDAVVLRSRKGYVSARRGGKVVLNLDTVPRKREMFYLRVALPSMMDLSKARLTIRARAGGARQIEASVLVPAGAGIAYEVLRDYDGFKEFIEDASESKMLERLGEGEFRVLMVQCHSFLMLTIPMTMVLKAVEDWDNLSVTMDLERGLGVKQYKGVWQAVKRSDGRCLVRCSITAACAVPAPGFLLDGLMSHATRAALEQIRAECIRRSAMVKENGGGGRRRSEAGAAEQVEIETESTE